MIRNPEIQFASADAIAAFQEERLRDEVAYPVSYTHLTLPTIYSV